MTLLDTNVISEPCGSPPQSRVSGVDRPSRDRGVVPVGRYDSGAALRDWGYAGRQRSVLHEWLEQEVLPLFAGQVRGMGGWLYRCDSRVP